MNAEQKKREKAVKEADFELRIKKTDKQIFVDIATNGGDVHGWQEASHMEMAILFAVGGMLQTSTVMSASSYACALDKEIESLFRLMTGEDIEVKTKKQTNKKTKKDE